MSDPIAQDPNAAQVTPESPGGSEVAAKPDAVQQRINELTAGMREAQRQAEAAQAQNMELTRMYAESMSRGIAPVAPPPDLAVPEGVDPSIARYFEEAAKRANAPILARLEAQLQQLQSQTAQQGVQQLLVGEDPKVAQRAQQLMDAWTRSGNTGWNPKDAVIYARGELGVPAPNPQAGRARNQLGQFNVNGMDVLNGQPPPNAIAAHSEPPVPAFADQTNPLYDPHQASAFWAKKMNGKSF